MDKETLVSNYFKLKNNLHSFGIKGAIALGGDAAMVMHGIVNECKDIVVYMLESAFTQWSLLPGGVVENGIDGNVYFRARQIEGIESIKTAGDSLVYMLPLVDILPTATEIQRLRIESHLYRSVAPYIKELLQEGGFYGSAIELPHVRIRDGSEYETILKKHFGE